MARHVKFFMSPEDERLFLQDLAPLGLTLYPDMFPADWVAPKVGAELAGTLEGDRYFLAAEELGDVLVDKMKRGPHRGMWKILEVNSPVILWDRSIVDDKGELRAGRIWVEPHLSGDSQRRVQKSTYFEELYGRIHEQLKKRGRRSEPTGYLVLPGAARLSNAGTPLREAGRKGELIRAYR